MGGSSSGQCELDAVGRLGLVPSEKPRQLEQTRHRAGIVVGARLLFADVVVGADHQDWPAGGTVAGNEILKGPTGDTVRLLLYRQAASLEGRPRPCGGSVEIVRPLETTKAGEPREGLDIGLQTERVRRSLGLKRPGLDRVGQSDRSHQKNHAERGKKPQRHTGCLSHRITRREE